MDNYLAEELEIIEKPIDEADEEIMSDWLSSIHFDKPVQDWKTGDTWGDPTTEYVPPEYIKYATVDDGSDDDEIEAKAGTVWGAKRAWLKRRMMLQEKINAAVNDRDARATIRAQRQISSGDTIYKSIDDILELIDHEQ